MNLIDVDTSIRYQYSSVNKPLQAGSAVPISREVHIMRPLAYLSNRLLLATTLFSAFVMCAASRTAFSQAVSPKSISAPAAIATAPTEIYLVGSDSPLQIPILLATLVLPKHKKPIDHCNQTYTAPSQTCHCSGGGTRQAACHTCKTQEHNTPCSGVRCQVCAAVCGTSTPAPQSCPN